MLIKLVSTGRNVIPYFKPDSIIQVHGQNGVGKSMAATMLEIGSGNYVFQSEGQFNRLKDVIETCNITIEAAGGRDQIEIRLTPGTWKFNQNLNGVNSVTIGNFFINGKEIKHGDFKKKVNIRVIRGDESLAQQVTFFRDIFTAKITRKVESIDSYLHVLENYKKALEARVSEKEMREYEQKQEKYKELLDKNENLESSIGNRQQTIESLRLQIPLLEKLGYILTHSSRDFPGEKKEIEERLDDFGKQLEEKMKEKVALQDRYKELESKADKELKEWIDAKKKKEKNLEKIKDRLRQLFDADALEKLLSTSDQQPSIQHVQRQIETVQASRDRAKDDFDALNEKYERVLGINGFLTRISEICERADDDPFATDAFILLPVPGGKTSITPRALKEIIAASMQKFTDDQQLKEYEAEVSKANAQITSLNAQEEILTQLDKVQRSILSLSQKIATKGTSPADIMDENALEAIPKRIEELNVVIEELNRNIRECSAKIEKIDTDARKLEELPSENVIAQELANLGFTMKKLRAETCSKRLEEVKKELARNEATLETQQTDQAGNDEKIAQAKRVLDDIIERIRAAGKEFGYSKHGEFLIYYKQHATRVDKLEKGLKKLQSKLGSLLKDLDAVISGRNARNATNETIIINEFDRIFKEMYDRPEFFSFVFKEYARIKRFDIKTRTIVFETKTGIEEMRDLNEFSSGEKTYAYCRAIITMLANSAEHCIIILDESYALLDYDHSEDLYQFQKEQVKNGNIAKFINILPLKEDLGSIVQQLQENAEKERLLGNVAGGDAARAKLEEYQQYLKEVQQDGYYQRVIPLA